MGDECARDLLLVGAMDFSRRTGIWEKEMRNSEMCVGANA